MKTEKLKNGMICVSVPKDAEKFSFHDDKTLRYKDLGVPTYKNFNTKNKVILGTITKDECSFDCGEFVLGGFCSSNDENLYENYLDNDSCFNNPLDSFKSMIEAETDFLFENPNKLTKNDFGGTIKHYQSYLKRHEKIKNRVIEKLLILKPL